MTLPQKIESRAIQSAGQAEAGAALRAAAAGVDPVEAFGEPRDMLGRDPLALVGDGQHDLLVGQLRPHRDRAGAAVADGVADEVVEQLVDLDPVGEDRWKPGRDLAPDRAAAAGGLALRVPHRFVDEGRKIHLVGWRREALRLDPRQRDQVFDHPLHPPRLVVDDRGEAPAGLAIELPILVVECLGIAEDGGERRAQLVAGIGDEIDPHALGGMGLAAIGEADEARAVGKQGDAHHPAPLGAADSDQLDLVAAGRRLAEPLERDRVADGEADVLADDMLAQHRPRRRIGDRDPPLRDDQARLGQSLDQVPQGGVVVHAAS
jgi:hypothetical protein